jgi:hypothetical protein
VTVRSISVNFIHRSIAPTQSKRLNLERRGFDSQVQFHRSGAAAVADSKLPHQFVRLLERIGKLRQPLRAPCSGQFGR